ncbi:hypothetical protein NAMH_1498 [Nautilia profundicola AmH]|uniref:Uncharacterized protein n=1 Tax=Nautilia profundicola (strain ATCC BAA-1463 / DSM 18972 / AmH) TaxID=598659 RepID=B9L6A0_NAUPA|nr:hypothetical protein [Nautilia profundicola]ACM93619.1 hypothetical protein NAMH_1498 [Nautilia profundicola AmH]
MSLIFRFIIYFANKYGEKQADELLGLLMREFPGKWEAEQYIKKHYKKEISEMEREHKKKVNQELERQLKEFLKGLEV